jgi:hypothetical protein
MAKPPAMTPEKLRIADAWYSVRRQPFKTIAAQLGVSINTLREAVHRRKAYRNFPRG